MKMKHYVSVAVLALAFAACSDDYDDSALWEQVNENTDRIEALETWQEQVNSNIEALQQLLSTTDYITSVIPLLEDNEVVGYTITFFRSDPITIRHGAKGEAGETPQIGLTQGEDGNWYWTLNGELMRDAEDNPIRANGEDGEDGQNGADGSDGSQGSAGADAPKPQISLGSSLDSNATIITDSGNKDDNAWYLSVDDGTTWYRISGGKGDQGATGPQGDSWFSDVKPSEDGTYYIFTLADNDDDDTNNPTFKVPIYQDTIKIGDGTGTLTLKDTKTTIDITLPSGTTADDYSALVAQITPEGADGTYTDIDSRAGDAVGGWSVTATLAESSSVTIKTTQAGTALLRVTLIRTDGSELTASCVVKIIDHEIVDGTYIVYTAEGLLAWAEAAQKDLSTSCTLAADINLPEPAEGESNWTPVANNNYYTGTFDGGGHTLTGLTVNLSETDYIGLFAVIDKGGTVKNLKMTDVNIEGTTLGVGAVAGGNYGTIENCSMEGNVTNHEYRAGGIVGHNEGTIIGCSAAGNIKSTTSSVGGIAGSQWKEGIIIDCHSSATLESNGSVGGVLGGNRGKLIACSSTGYVENKGTILPYAGGVVGEQTYDSGSITACYATGKVIGSDDYTGGVAGCNHGGSITASYWSNENTKGVGEGDSSGATKVDDSNVTWQTAAEEMNKALTENGYSNYHWVENTGADKETRPLILVRN